MAGNNGSSRLLIIGKHWPEPRSSAAGSRMIQLIEALRKGFEITFASSAGESEHAENLESFGVNLVRIQLNDASFDDFVRGLNPAVVLFDRFMTEEQFGWRVSDQCPNALRVLDMEDLHALRHAREKALKESGPMVDRRLVNDVAKREIASIYRCDLTLVISEYEMEVLRSFYKVPDELLFYLPFMVLPSAELSDSLAFSNRQHFVTVGNFLHAPNLDGVKYLKAEVWPHIRKQLPNAEMHVYGAYSGEKVMKLEDKGTGFLMKGRADDVRGVMRSARICLSPLRFGAGLKGKFLASLQSLTPCVTTTIGAEGIAGGMPWPGAIADEPEELANAAAELYGDEALWKEKSAQCLPLIQQRFHRDFWTAALRAELEDVRINLETRRLANFTGAMLQFHAMRSTEFMSRWIEAKNKLSGDRP